MLLRVFIILDSRGSAVAPRYAVRKNRSGYPAPCDPLCWESPCFVRPSNVYRVNSLLLCVLPHELFRNRIHREFARFSRAIASEVPLHATTMVSLVRFFVTFLAVLVGGITMLACLG